MKSNILNLSLVAELAAELPGELRDVVHRQGQPAAVEAAPGPELDGPAVSGVAVDAAALAGGDGAAPQQAGGDGLLRLLPPDQGQGAQ